MPEIVISTICSSQKREDEGLLPAYQRYQSQHIIDLREYAEKEGLPLFIISGRYGFISAETEIPYYNHPLLLREVEDFSIRMCSQISVQGIREIRFYTKVVDAWIPYLRALRYATESAGVVLTITHLPDD
jgi:hypothetical protein